MMLLDAAPGTPLPEGMALRSIRPPSEDMGTEKPEAKPPKPFAWRFGDYYVAPPTPEAYYVAPPTPEAPPAPPAV